MRYCHALVGVVDKPIRILELRMVKDVESFCPELQFGALGDGGALEQSHIIIVEPRTREVPPHCISNLPVWFRLEEARGEIWQPLSRVLIFKKVGAVVRVAWHVGVCIKGAKK
jgi:hypothetical protein